MAVPRPRAFTQVDVFGRAPYLGNPVAVVVDAEDLDPDRMQRLARWTNLSETTFLLPPTNPEADYRVRIFTPGGELPFAGHPTLGSARAWLNSGGTPQHDDVVVQECAVGLVTVRILDNALAFQAPSVLREGPLAEEYLDATVRAFGITRDDVVAHQWVDNGPGWAVLVLDSAEKVLALEPDLSQIPDAMVGAVGRYPDGAEHDFELRTFAPGMGAPEDPVCGSMNASVAQWLIGTGAAPSSYRVSQGARVGHSGTIEISTDARGAVWVAGTAIAYIDGIITV